MSHRFPLAPFTRSPKLSRRGDLRLCRSTPVGSIPAGNAYIAKVPLMLENQNELRTPATGNTSKDVHLYEVRPRKDKRGVDLISDALPFGRLWYGEP